MAIDECGSHDYKQAIPRVLSVSILFIGTYDDHMNCFYHKQANDNPQEQIEQLHEHFKGIALH